jgi:hypothetical protein
MILITRYIGKLPEKKVRDLLERRCERDNLDQIVKNMGKINVMSINSCVMVIPRFNPSVGPRS